MLRAIQRLVPGLWLPLLLLVACASEPVPSSPPPMFTPFPPDLYIGLSDSAAPLADLVERSYESATGKRAPIFLVGNDQTLLDDLEQGVLEAAIVYHLPADSEFWFNPIAVDGVVMIAHPDLAVQDLTINQLQDILSGTTVNWSELIGTDLAVELLNREVGSGARQLLEGRVMQNSRFSNLAQIAPTDEFMRQEVSRSPGSIGYTMMASVEGESISLDGHAASQNTVADQSYPLTTPVYFVTRVEPVGPARDFLAWLQSPGGQDVLGEKYGRVR